jgi:hypothetical protein
MTRNRSVFKRLENLEESVWEYNVWFSLLCYFSWEK